MLHIPKSFIEFAHFAEQGNIIPVAKILPADLLSPVSAFLRLREQSPYSFLFESVEGGEQVARYSFLGVSPHIVLRVKDSQVTLTSGSYSEPQEGTLFDVMRRYFSQLVPVQVPDLPPFTGGAVGFMGYDTVRWFETVPNKNADLLNIDNAVIMLFSCILAFDHVRQQLSIIVNVFTEGVTQDLEIKYQQALDKITELEALLAAPIKFPPRQRRTQPPQLRPNLTKEQYEQSVEKAKQYIKSGDIFQVVLSQRFEIDVVTHPLQIYRALRMVNPSPFMFYLELDDLFLIGSSPEMLVKCQDKQLYYRPIAGTRARGSSDVEDALLGEELRADEKEVAEHIMLVDLGRNDLGKVSQYTSVEVTELMSIERYSHVIHMVSSLHSQLSKDKDCFDALSACFPAGTVSGAPKVRAMEIIDELEPTRRGPYAGTVLYLDHSGNLNSCIAIRTIIIKDGKAYMQAGAGIVADSIPEKEFIETVNKARALMKAIELAEKGF